MVTEMAAQFNHFNPLSPRGERHDIISVSCWGSFISIHSPRVGRDWFVTLPSGRRYPFQSTLPAWGETNVFRKGGNGQRDFNPLSPRGERLDAAAAFGRPFDISIHSPRVGRDIAVTLAC